MNNSLKIKILFLFCICLFTIIGLQCNSISDSESTTYEYIKDNKQYFYRKDTLHLFYPEEGYQVDFHGIRSHSLTTIVGKDSSTADTTDSLYMVRFRTGRDTVLLTGDTINGEARFQLSDIKSNYNWDFIVVNIFADTNLPVLMARIIADYMDPNQVDTLIQTDSSYKLTPSNKASFINALNEIVNTDTLYYHYRAKITNAIWDTNFTNDVNRLIEENIMVDTTGRIHNNIDIFQREQLKRFNYNIFTVYFDSDPDKPIFTPFPVSGRIFTFTVQEGSSNRGFHDSITRFLKVNDTAMNQLFYVDKNGNSITPQNKKFTGYFMFSGMDWGITPLLLDLDLPLIPKSDIPNIVSAGNAIMYFDTLEGTQDDAKKYYTMIVNYSLSGGAFLEDGEWYYFSGFASISADFYNRSFGNSMFSIHTDRGYFTNMDVDIVIHAKNLGGKELLYREKRLLETDSLKAM
jgi:hypothetical protein